MAKTMTHEEFIKRIEEKYPGIYTFTSEYKGNKKPISFICNRCGNESTIENAGNLKGKPCKKCGIIDENAFKKILEEGYSIKDASNLTKTKGNPSKTPIKICHDICGTIYDSSYNNYQQGRRCPKCANDKRASIIAPKIENYLDSLLLSTFDGKEYEWKDQYNHDNKEKLTIIHKNCNNEYKVRPNDFQQGYRCPYCCPNGLMPRFSRMSIFIGNLLKLKDKTFIREYTNDGCCDKVPLPFDFKVDNIIIEYDGSQHFKYKTTCITEEKFEETKKHDAIKNQFVLNSTFNFIRIPYTVNEIGVEKIINEIAEYNEVSKDTINEYNLLAKFNECIYNLESYYEHRE